MGHPGLHHPAIQRCQRWHLIPTTVADMISLNDNWTLVDEGFLSESPRSDPVDGGFFEQAPRIEVRERGLIV